MSKPKGDSLSPAGIDTNILVYELRTEGALAKIKDVEKRKRAIRVHRQARRLLRDFHEQKRPVVLSVISLGEYLVKVPEAQREKVARRLDERFTIAPYNRQAAIFAAGIVEKAKNRAKTVRVVGGRPVVMADTKIIASLAVAGASVVYFHDSGARKIAEGFVNAKGLPEHPDDLFDYAEDHDL